MVYVLCSIVRNHQEGKRLELTQTLLLTFSVFKTWLVPYSVGMQINVFIKKQDIEVLNTFGGAQKYCSRYRNVRVISVCSVIL